MRMKKTPKEKEMTRVAEFFTDFFRRRMNKETQLFTMLPKQEI